jgi:hypothetical protein
MTDSTHATSTDQDQPAHLCLSVITYIVFRNSLKIINGFVQIERWASPFKVFSEVRVKEVITNLLYALASLSV